MRKAIICDMCYTPFDEKKVKNTFTVTVQRNGLRNPLNAQQQMMDFCCRKCMYDYLSDLEEHHNKQEAAEARDNPFGWLYGSKE